MRISTNMIYDRGVGSIQQQWSNILQTQQQVATGRRVLTPADDPISSARALEISQSQNVNGQFQTNIGYADDRLKLLEGKLTGVTDTLQYIREKVVAAGNGAYSDEDLRYTATDLRAQFEALLALANSQDGTGDYLFAGYRANEKPFEGDLAGVGYNGDHGTQTVQVSASRFMPVSLPGSDVFLRTQALTPDIAAVKTGVREDGSANQGDASLAASLVVPVDSSLLGRRYAVTYRDDGVSPPSWEVSEYRPDVATPITTSVATLPATIDGFTLDVASGSAVDGDRFEVFISSPNVFDNLGMLIDAMERPGPSGMAGGAVAEGLRNIDAGLENILKTRAQIGSQLTETEALTSLGSDLDLQYATTLSGLQDVDYAEAISRLTQQQTYLQAAQQSFMRVSGLSLFNYLS